MAHMNRSSGIEAVHIQGVDIYMAEALVEASGAPQDGYVEEATYSAFMDIDMDDIAESHIGAYLGIPEGASNTYIQYKLEKKWDISANHAVFVPRVIVGGDVLASDVSSRKVFTRDRFTQEQELSLEDLDFHYGLLRVIIRERAELTAS